MHLCIQSPLMCRDFAKPTNPGGFVSSPLYGASQKNPLWELLEAPSHNGRKLAKPLGDVSMLALQCNVLFMMWTSFNMSVIHFNFQLQMGEGPPQCTCHFNSQPLMGEGSSTLHMSFQLSTAVGGGILHISHPVNDIIQGVCGQDPPHFTSRQSHISGSGCLVSSTFHIQ